MVYPFYPLSYLLAALVYNVWRELILEATYPKEDVQEALQEIYQCDFHLKLYGSR